MSQSGSESAAPAPQSQASDTEPDSDSEKSVYDLERVMSEMGLGSIGGVDLSCMH